MVCGLFSGLQGAAGGVFKSELLECGSNIKLSPSR
jgi:hypothetical protein